MPRLNQRDTRKRFLSLYRFIETDLTEENWRDLTHRAARFKLAPRRSDADSQANKRARIHRSRGGARYRAVALDIGDLGGARALQERFRQELVAIRAGDSSSAHTSLTRLLEMRFDRLKRLLTKPPLYAQEHVQVGGVRTLETRGPAYFETRMIEHVCPSCGSTYTARSDVKRTSCGQRACRIDVENARRKQPPAIP